VAVTVAVLTGALLVGDSVRGSLRDLHLLRLGETAYVITADGFFREALADDLQKQPRFSDKFVGAVAVIALEGMVTHEPSGLRGSGVQVYGVDSRFWEFHAHPMKDALQDGALLLSSSLAEEFQASLGDSMLVRVQRHSTVPSDSLHGRKTNLARSQRFKVGAILGPQELGEFSLRPQQGAVRAAFLPLKRLQENLRQEGRVNTILVSASDAETADRADDLGAVLRRAASLEDLGIRLRTLEAQRALSIESERILIQDRVVEKAHEATEELGFRTVSIFSYLANTIRTDSGEIPYSLVTAMAPEPGATPSPEDRETLPPIWLNEWAWRDLSAQLGDEVALEYYLWEDGGELLTRTARFHLGGVLPMDGIGGDRNLAPDFPGITESERVGGWDPPFPIDLSRIRDRDEDYWDRYRAAPKAFLPLEVGQQLWQSRYGKLTAIRLLPPDTLTLTAAHDALRERLQAALDPLQTGFAIYAVRAEGAEASRGAVNFGEYFFYFSFFLVVSALLLTGLFFRLGIEQRLREIGLLQAVGFSSEKIRALFLAEGIILAVLGSLLGLAGAVGYGWLMMFGLRTWWVDAVGTTLLTLHLSPISLVTGGLAGVLAALLTILVVLRGLRAATARGLLAGTVITELSFGKEVHTAVYWGGGFALAGVVLLMAGVTGGISDVAGFFGSGTLLLAALITFQWAWLSGRRRRLLAQRGFGALLRMGVRNAAWRPGRSLLCIGLVASATFVLVAVESFRHREGELSLERQSGTGGFPLLAETLIPFPFDPNTADGREFMNISDSDLANLQDLRFTSFRLRPGEDTSCLNLYQPRNPKILGVPAELIRSNRFAFRDSLAETEEERRNPWTLLETNFPDGAIPAIVDANTMTYILHLGLGEDFIITQASGEQVRLRLVAALSDSIFQSELLISEENFLRLFPHVQGFRFFLLDLPLEKSVTVSGLLEENLSDSGFDVMPTSERLATYHRVENTYLSTFQALGGLGLLLGTLGLAAVLLRNLLERRRELALLHVLF
jgi:ABC-type lipoprotein release transport system permease subunit